MGTASSKHERIHIAESAKEVAASPSTSTGSLSNEKIHFIRKRLNLLSHDNASHEKLETVYFHLPCYSLHLSIHGVCTLLAYQSYLVIACSLLPWYYKESIRNLVFLKTAPVVYVPKARVAVELDDDSHAKLLHLAKRLEKSVPDFICTKNVPIRRAEEGSIVQTTGTIRLHNNLRHLISIAPDSLRTYYVDEIENVRLLLKAPEQFYFPAQKLVFDLRGKSVPQLSSREEEQAQKEPDSFALSSHSTADGDKEDEDVWNLLSKDTTPITLTDPGSTTLASAGTTEDLPTDSTLVTPYDDCGSNFGSSDVESPASATTYVSTPLEEMKQIQNMKQYFSLSYGLNEIEFWLPLNVASSEPIVATTICSHNAYESNCLSVRKGDTVQLLSRTSSGWSLCLKDEVIGWIPTIVVPSSVSEDENHVATIRPVIIVQVSYVATNINELSVFEGDAVVFITPVKHGYLRVRVYGVPFREGEVPIQCFQESRPTIKLKHQGRSYVQSRTRKVWRRKGSA